MEEFNEKIWKTCIDRRSICDAKETDKKNEDIWNNTIKQTEENNRTNAKQCMEGWSRLTILKNDGLCLSNDEGIRWVVGFMRPIIVYCSRIIQENKKENNGQWGSYSIVIYVPIPFEFDLSDTNDTFNSLEDVWTRSASNSNEICFYCFSYFFTFNPSKCIYSFV